MQTDKHRVMLWTAPRCVSTAFERSIRTLPCVRVFTEPFSSAYYFGPDRLTSRFAADLDEITLSNGPTFDSVVKTLHEASAEKVEAIFSKDMAYYLNGMFELLLRPQLSRTIHTFLIRDPRKSVPSLYRGHGKVPVEFDPKEAGFQELHELYCFVKEKMGCSSPVVIDADDLLAAPDRMMEAYCSATGLRFDPNMTKWEPGALPEWNEMSPWSSIWFADLSKSSGFVKKEQSHSEPSLEDLDLPQEVLQCIRHNLPFYRELHKERIVL